MNYRRFALFAFSLYAFFYDWIIEPQKKYQRSHSMECPALAFWTRPVFIAIGKDYTNPGSLKKKLDLYDLSWSSWVGAWWWIQLKPIEIDTNNDSFGVWNMIRTFENMPILGTLLKFQGSYLDLQKKQWKKKSRTMFTRGRWSRSPTFELGVTFSLTIPNNQQNCQDIVILP